MKRRRGSRERSILRTAPPIGAAEGLPLTARSRAETAALQAAGKTLASIGLARVRTVIEAVPDSTVYGGETQVRVVRVWLTLGGVAARDALWSPSKTSCPTGSEVTGEGVVS